jgi:hypothetical protein
MAPAFVSAGVQPSDAATWWAGIDAALDGGDEQVLHVTQEGRVAGDVLRGTPGIGLEGV